MSSLEHDLNRADRRYRAIVEQYDDALKAKKNMTKIDSDRTRVHNNLIACFTSYLRNQTDKDPAMIKALQCGRVGIRDWALIQGFELNTVKASSDQSN